MMKKLMTLIFCMIPALSLASQIQLAHGQKANYARRSILCSQTRNVDNNCFAHPLKDGKMGIVLPNKKVISTAKGMAFIGKLEELYSSNTCDNFYSFSLNQANHMPSGSVLRFSDRSYRCPSSQEVTRKTCKLISNGSSFEIQTPGGLKFRAEKLHTTQIKLKRLAQMGICNDVTEI